MTALVAGAAACSAVGGRGQAGGATSVGSGAGAGAGGGGGGGDAQPDGSTAAAGPGGVGVWSASFVNVGVTAIALGANGHLYLTGQFGAFAGTPVGPASSLGCPGGDAGASGQSGFLVELDDGGKCVWGYVFGQNAQGTSVAVDDAGDVAVSAYYGDSVGLVGSWPGSAPQGFDKAFVALFDGGHTLKWARTFSDAASASSQRVLGVALNDTELAVAGFFSSALYVTSPPGGPASVTVATSSDPADGFAIRFDPQTGAILDSLLVTSAGMGLGQGVQGVALDGHGTIALTGQVVGPALFGAQGTPAPDGKGDIYTAAYGDGQWDFVRVLGVEEQGAGTSVAFDGAGDVYMGAGFDEGVELSGPGTDGGVYTAGGGGTLVARYDRQGTLLGSVGFGAGAPPSNVYLAGVVPHADPGGETVTIVATVLGPPAVLRFQDGSTLPLPAKAGTFALKLDATLREVRWLEGFGVTDGTDSTTAAAVVVGPDGSVYMAGSLRGALDFGGTAKPLFVSPSAGASFVVKLTP